MNFFKNRCNEEFVLKTISILILLTIIGNVYLNFKKSKQTTFSGFLKEAYDRHEVKVQEYQKEQYTATIALLEQLRQIDFQKKCKSFSLVGTLKDDGGEKVILKKSPIKNTLGGAAIGGLIASWPGAIVGAYLATPDEETMTMSKETYFNECMNH